MNTPLSSLALAVCTVGCSSPVAGPPIDGSVGTDVLLAGDVPPESEDVGAWPDAPTAHTVGDCTDLGPAFELQRISPPELLGVTNVIVDPFRSGTIYIGSEPGGIYRSDDCGATWTKVNVGRDGDVVDGGMNWVLLASPEEEGVLYTNAFENTEHLGLLVSRNGGRDWDRLDSEYAQVASMDPTDARHLLMTVHDNCDCMRESTDGGATWRSTGSPATLFTEGAGAIALGPNAWLYTLLGDGCWLTDDGGVTYTMVTTGGGGQYHWAADGALYVAGLDGVVRSRDRGRHFDSLPDSPRSTAVVSDGRRLYAGYVGDESETLYVSDDMGEGPWMPMPGPSGFGGPVNLAYDRDHHVLYSANGNDGGALWRVVTE